MFHRLSCRLCDTLGYLFANWGSKPIVAVRSRGAIALAVGSTVRRTTADSEVRTSVLTSSQLDRSNGENRRQMARDLLPASSRLGPPAFYVGVMHDRAKAGNRYDCRDHGRGFRGTHDMRKPLVAFVIIYL